MSIKAKEAVIRIVFTAGTIAGAINAVGNQVEIARLNSEIQNANDLRVSALNLGLNEKVAVPSFMLNTIAIEDLESQSKNGGVQFVKPKEVIERTTEFIDQATEQREEKTSTRDLSAVGGLASGFGLLSRFRREE